MGFPVRQIVQESVENRMLEHVSVSPVPQTMEAVVEVFPPTPQERVLSRMQERVQNRPRGCASAWREGHAHGESVHCASSSR